MAKRVEEEQVGVCVRLDQHHNAGGDDSKKGNDIHSAYAVQDNIPGA